MMALVFKSTQGFFRLIGRSLEKSRKYLLFQVVAATIWAVDIVVGIAEKGLFSTSKG